MTIQCRRKYRNAFHSLARYMEDKNLYLSRKEASDYLILQGYALGKTMPSDTQNSTLYAWLRIIKYNHKPKTELNWIQIENISNQIDTIEKELKTLKSLIGEMNK
jgi:hypothetical protein